MGYLRKDKEEKPVIKNGPKKKQGTSTHPGKTSASKEQVLALASDAGTTTPPSTLTEPNSQWYAGHPHLTSSTNPPITPAKLASLTAHAASLHTSTIATYQSQSGSTATTTTSDFSFLQQIIQSGTLSDKLSALTLLVQSSPMHNIKALETLKGMAERGKGKGGREESLKALRCVVDWWVGGGVPNRKLKYFRDQELTHPGVTNQHLLLWYFEDWLKKYFFSVLQILETLSLDPLLYVRTQALSLIFTLLRDKPEQEHNLLRLLVNKLGDAEKSICSRASYHLLQVTQSHPSMKSIIVREITSLVLRPAAALSTSTSVNTHMRFNDVASSAPRRPKVSAVGPRHVNAHARYYATITCNQMALASRDRGVALELINMYFEIFKELLGEGSGEDDVPETDPVEDSQEDGKGKRKGKDKGKDWDHKGSRFDRAKGRAKAKEIRGELGFAEVEDEHSKLISAILTGVNRALPFTKISSADAGLNKHIDTLFFITHTSTFNISLQALLLIQQIATSLTTSSISPTSSITDRYYRTLYASLHDPRLAASSKQAMYLNLLFKALKTDQDKERVKAFIRRFVQVLGSGGAAEFVAGGLYLLGELFSAIPRLRDMLSAASEGVGAKGEYDPRKREPQFAHVSASPLWELIPLANHYHPTVSLHARQLLSSQPLTASADLSPNTLSHFLDRFVYKNPKKLSNAKSKGASVMQPAASANNGVGVKLIKGEVLRGAGAPVNEKFWMKKMEDVPVDQMFFHRFFSQKNENERAKAAKVDKHKRKDHGSDSISGSEYDEQEAGDEDDGDSQALEQESNASQEDAEEDSDTDEAEIWKVMQATMPKESGDSDVLVDSDSDDVPSDLEDGTDSDEDDEADGAVINASESEDGADEEDAENSDALSLADESNNEDLIGLGCGQKRKRDEEKKDGGRRKKLRSLPTFASYEDYARLINEGPEDDI